MASIPLEDNFEDILGKAQRGLSLDDQELAKQAGISSAQLAAALGGQVDETVLRKLACPLGLEQERLVASARKSWAPREHHVTGLAPLTTHYALMTVNAYLAWDPHSLEAAAFDTGADCAGMLALLKERQLSLKLVLLTHTHADHVADLARLKTETGAAVYVSERESAPGAKPFAEGKSFQLGSLKIETRLTSGHSSGGTTYVIWGLAVPVAVVGDALFAGSMGGGMVSYANALANNRHKILTLPDETVLCPGHGPLTSVAEEKQHNPFFPELATRQ